MHRLAFLAALAIAAPAATAGTVTLAPERVVEWKPIFGVVAARTDASARARVGGVVEELLVAEGDEVAAGQRIATVRDDKIAYQVAAFDAQIAALKAQLATAETELGRGRTLVSRGVATAQQLDQLATAVDVTRGQLAAAEAGRAVVVEQGAEGDVVAPEAGRVLTVPVSRGSVVLPGEPVATIGAGGLFLRLSIPERHAGSLVEGAAIRIGFGGSSGEGRLAKVYPEILGGRVTADVEVADLPTTFVNARVPVELPVGERDALLAPAAAIETRAGLDFATVRESDADVARVVVVGERRGDRIEILSGLRAGDVLVTP